MSGPVEVKTTKVSVAEHEFHLNESGDPAAPTIMFLHGSGPGATGASNWEAVLADLGADYHCVAPDVIGFGDSSCPDPPPQGLGPFTTLRVNALIGLIQELGLGPTTIVGNSMGGMWTLGVARQAPELVDKIVLMGSGGAPNAFGPSLPKLVGYYENPTREAMAALLEEFVYDASLFGDELQNIAAARIQRANRPEIERSHRATFDLSAPWSLTEDDFAAIAHEVLIIHGREDTFVPFSAGLYFFDHLVNSRLYGIGRCGHWAQIEHHDQFVAVIRGFLGGAL